jgi:hypothetical protein
MDWLIVNYPKSNKRGNEFQNVKPCVSVNQFHSQARKSFETIFCIDSQKTIDYSHWHRCVQSHEWSVWTGGGLKNKDRTRKNTKDKLDVNAHEFSRPGRRESERFWNPQTPFLPNIAVWLATDHRISVRCSSGFDDCWWVTNSSPDYRVETIQTYWQLAIVPKSNFLGKDQFFEKLEKRILIPNRLTLQMFWPLFEDAYLEC